MKIRDIFLFWGNHTLWNSGITSGDLSGPICGYWGLNPGQLHAMLVPCILVPQ